MQSRGCAAESGGRCTGAHALFYLEWKCAGNKIGHEGAKAMAEALKTNSSVKEFNMRGVYCRGVEERREERCREGTHAHARSYLWLCVALSLQAATLEMKALRPWRGRSRQTPL